MVLTHSVAVVSSVAVWSSHLSTNRIRFCFFQSKCVVIVSSTFDFPSRGLCIKVGRGQGNGDIGTRVWGLGTWGRETRDAGTSSMGRGDAGTRGRQKLGRRGPGMLMIIAKVGGKCDISFFVKMCYLWSTLDSIFQNHIGHLMMFTQNISL